MKLQRTFFFMVVVGLSPLFFTQCQTALQVPHHRPTATMNAAPGSTDPSAPQDNLEPANRQALQKTLREGHGEGAVTAMAAMEELLTTWNPVGLSAQQVKATLGEPNEARHDVMCYTFNTGNLGWIYAFELENNQVIELHRLQSE